MSLNRNGLLAGGNFIIDTVKIIDKYPEQDALANITDRSDSNGGSPFNILLDLAKLNADFPLEAVGLLGEDALGKMALSMCEKAGIKTDLLRLTPLVDTSFTDVMSVKDDGRRTFFHYRGANALLDVHHFDLEKSSARIFHIGYALLLDKLDELRPDGSTGMAELLNKASALGFETSLDLVSESSDRFAKVITPSLPHCDYVFMNEYEAQKITGLPIDLHNDRPTLDSLEKMGKLVLALGVKQWVIIHHPKLVIAVGHNGTVLQPSVAMPTSHIKGAVGAGDALAAGVLLGLHNRLDMQICLNYGVCAAASCLLAPTTSDGILPLPDALALAQKYGYNA